MRDRHKGHDHPTELHAAICEHVALNYPSHRKAAADYEVTNTTLSGWINDGNTISMDADRQKVLEGLLGVEPYEVVRMWGGLDLEGGATVGGPSPRSPQSQIDATSKVVSIHGRKRDAEIYPITGRQLDLPEAAGL